ncbi:MAG: MFS transporter [Desulfofundulus sp.]|uniref:MFS transporter n=1 Tax=Desulfofundulus sp. TaxID=2282750 RepID=UPI003C74A50D
MSKNIGPVTILFITLFLVMAGFGIVIPIFPFMIVKLGGGPATLGFFMATYSLMQFIFAPLWGRLSDRIGRRPFLLMGLSGYGITFILFGLASKLWMMFAIRILSGIISSATLPTAMAYIADKTSGEERSRGMGMMGAAMGLGMIAGPAIGGWLGHYNFTLPFFVAGGLAILNLLFAISFLPESLEKRGPSKATGRDRITLNVLKNPLLVIFVLGFVLYFTMSMFEATFALFAAQKAGFGPREVGVLFAILGLTGVAVQGGLLGKLAKRFGDVNLIRTGMLVSSLGMLLILTTSNRLLLILNAAIFNTGTSLLGPSASSLLSKNASGRQASAMGLMQSSNSLGRILGPVAGGALYDLHMNVPYFSGAAIMLLTAAATWFKIASFEPPKLVEQTR